MQHTSILAISSSKVGDSGYLEKAISLIREHLGSDPLNVAFIPFAAADGDYIAYEARVREALQTLPYTITAVTPENATEVLETCNAIMVGGGNTFKLLHDIYDLQLFQIIREKISSGISYIGWSAGANITGLTICTTNDMPIIEPESFKAFAFLPFQINPHYYNQVTEGFNGETRDQRLEEYLKLNKDKIVIGLPEGTALKLEGGRLNYLGQEPAIIFSLEQNAPVVNRQEVANSSDLSYLLRE